MKKKKETTNKASRRAFISNITLAGAALSVGKFTLHVLLKQTIQ